MLLDSWPNFEFPLYLLENSYSNIIFCVCVFFRLHKELWDNQPNELNDGPACRCSLKARQIGICHGINEGEKDSLLEFPFSLHKFHNEFQFF